MLGDGEKPKKADTSGHGGYTIPDKLGSVKGDLHFGQGRLLQHMSRSLDHALPSDSLASKRAFENKGGCSDVDSANLPGVNLGRADDKEIIGASGCIVPSRDVSVGDEGISVKKRKGSKSRVRDACSIDNSVDHLKMKDDTAADEGVVRAK